MSGISSTWKQIIGDVETNGLIPLVNKLHCLCILDIKTEEIRKFSSLAPAYGHEPLSEGIKVLGEADRIYGHNWVGYDGPVLELLVGFKMNIAKVRDTLLLSQMIWPEIKNSDRILFKRGLLPGKLIGSHGLEAWGYRLKENKGTFGKSTDWQECTVEMVDYCAQDIRTNLALLRRIFKAVREGVLSAQSIELEHDVAELCGRMTRTGYPMHMDRLVELYSDLCSRRAELVRSIRLAFPAIERTRQIIPKANNSKYGYVKGVPFVHRKMEQINPNSREHIAERLRLKYGWVAPVEPKTGNPKLDDDVLKPLDFPEIPLIREYFVVQKTLGMVGLGPTAWMKMERDGRLHPRFNTCGAVTGRMTHSSPNIAQVPKVAVSKEKGILKGYEGGFGFECRSVFTVPKGWKQVGVDMSGLELRCLAHFLAEYDDGKYTKEVLTGDVHTVTQKAAGLPSRDNAKTFIYAFLYGAGDEKIGSIVCPNGTSEEQKAAGKKLKEAFLKGLPALDQLRKACRRMAEKGYIMALDGRRLPIRHTHAALNTLLQSAGALACKLWIVLFDKAMQAEGYEWGKDYIMMATIHDEVQVGVRTDEIAAIAARLGCESATKAGEQFAFRCRLDGDAKIGSDWAECH